MDPVSLIVWGAVGIVLVLAMLFALKIFGRLLFFVLGLAALVVVFGMITDPHGTMDKVNVFVAQVNGLILQLKTSLKL